ncbi:MAG: carbohydrate binding family 9 domain-containing protein [Bacteroidales bacterium]|nr:carbohydrate binding family 9 domain-containing protein [Bacteroidales bacterium]
MKRLPALLFLFYLINFFSANTLFGQIEKKQVKAVKIEKPPLIDGILNDSVWMMANPATGFMQYEPVNGGEAGLTTQVYFLYDDIAIYIGAMMFDSNPDSILTELGFRDSYELNADYISFEINPFNDGINTVIFGLSASGIQYDLKVSDDDDDMSWNAVWKSDVAIVENGWSAEVMIPYSELRFPKESSENWGLNIWRNVRRTREIQSWNFVDKEIEGTTKQAGELTGLINIKPPLRLSFTPYVSGYLEKNAADPDWGYKLNYGMDLKYGITEAFTLDMTLIPDFGQVQSDDQVYNLSPFEIYYDERRPFFTEGTELFEKGNVFYSRRIGSMPEGYSSVNDSLNEGEYIKDNPASTNLINATKISGRTNKGLGIGVFNAISATTYATLSDSMGNTRRVETQPFSNYNMLVLDQNLKNNSYLSFYNTNVYKGKDHYTANVSGTQFLLFNSSSSYSVYGRFNLSQKYIPKDDNELGFMYNVKLSKTSGQFRFTFSQFVEDDKYDPNDLGYLQANNEISNSLELNYNFYNPFWKLLRLNNEVTTFYKMLYKPREYSGFGIEGNSWGTFRNYLTLGIDFEIKPVDQYDYYEARTPGQPFIIPPHWTAGIFLSPDYRKPFIVDFKSEYARVPQLDYTSLSFSFSPRWRVNDRLTFRFTSEWDNQNNDYGYVTDIVNDETPEIIFGRRDLENVENIFQTTYIFTNKIALDFRLRHYWLKANYEQYFQLDPEGNLITTDYTGNNDFNFNTFNIDMILRWEFAPGSEMALAWKNAILTYNDGEVVDRYFENLRNTLDSPADNSFSIKLLYYLDYLYFKKRTH